MALLVLGHKPDTLLLLHKATFVVWGAVGAPGGAGLWGALVGAALGSGFVLAFALLPTIDAWQGAAG